MICEFHYKYIKRTYDAKFLLTDTDSLVYEIETEDVYGDFYGDKNLFNFSDSPQDSKFFDLVNEKVIGKMKDKFRGKIASEFVGFNSNCWILVDLDGVRKIKEQKESIKMLLKTQNINNFLMLCLIKN